MKRLRTFLLSLLLGCFALLTGCGGATPPPSPDPVSITVSGMRQSFTFGERFTAAGLKAVVSYSDGTSRSAATRDYEIDSSRYNGAAEGEYTIRVQLRAAENIFTEYRVTVARAAQGGGEKEPEQNGLFDLYIVAGQSNAVGYSSLDGTDPAAQRTYETVLGAEDARNRQGYDVRYFGAVNIGYAQEIPEIEGTSVKMGLGQSERYIGPELGMANAITAAKTGRPSAIVKFGAGGTFLCDEKCVRTESQDFGTWASPSMIEKMEDPLPRAGELYRKLLEVIERSVEIVTGEGYVPIVRGIAWMQGEADASDPVMTAAYEEGLKLLISDLRTDVRRITGDAGAETCPFVVGKISPSGWYGSYVAAVREAEDKVARETENVVTVETEDLKIHDGGTLLGSDDWHFNALDMYFLGQRFARAILTGVTG